MISLLVRFKQEDKLLNQLITAIILLLSLSLLSQTKTTYTYAIKGLDTLKLDVYTPENVVAGSKLPTLLWMHGGGFFMGSLDQADNAKLCSTITKYGYIGISISYRLLRKNTETKFGCLCPKEDKMETFKQASIDYLDAAAFIVKNASLLHVDTSKIIAGGSSAGAESILNAVYMREYFAENLQNYSDVKFAGVLSLAGAMIDSNYITQANALPSVLFHGTDDTLVPFASGSHHLCAPEKPGYLMLDGSKVIVEKLDALETSYYFNVVKGGRHEVSNIPFFQLDHIIDFFNSTVLNNKVIQTKVIENKTLQKP